jgi:hypothetical protein
VEGTNVPISLGSPATTVNVVSDGRNKDAYPSWYYAAALFKGVALVAVFVWAIVFAIRAVW